MSHDKDDQAPRGEIRPEERDAFRRRSEALGRKLEDVKESRAEPDRNMKLQGQGMAAAFKYMIELLVGVCVGAAIGWFLDRQLGTMPLFLIAFLLLGFVAGMVNMIRAAQKESAKIPKGTAQKPSLDDDET